MNQTPQDLIDYIHMKNTKLEKNEPEAQTQTRNMQVGSSAAKKGLELQWIKKQRCINNMRLSVRQEIITLFWPTLENPQLDHCGSIRENRDRLGRLKHSSQNDKRTQNCDLQAKAEEEGFVSSNKGEV